jgi:23S rRNA (cytidine2498-2'-O)-methyltransferase
VKKYPNVMEHIFLYCRSGFERECAQEIADRAIEFEIEGETIAEANTGFVVYSSAQAGQVGQRQKLNALVFARQWIHAAEYVDDLPTRDRVTPLIERCGLRGKFGEVFVEHADTNEAKTLSSFCRKFSAVFSLAASESGLLDSSRANSLPRLHLFFLDSGRCHIGHSWPNNASPWPMGIPRLRFPAGAPSRSTLKLAEAFMSFLSREEQEQRLRAGMRAVDLGAAPGGWSWQFASRGIHVAAIDNGPLSRDLLATGMVEHLKTDGFHYRPRRPVDWMVCDMVEKPLRIARLVADWVARGDCRETIFNLKLPMKKRYETVEEARLVILSELQKAGVASELRMKQLYHDREEVTGYLRRLANGRAKR